MVVWCSEDILNSLLAGWLVHGEGEGEGEREREKRPTSWQRPAGITCCAYAPKEEVRLRLLALELDRELYPLPKSLGLS